MTTYVSDWGVAFVPVSEPFLVRTRDRLNLEIWEQTSLERELEEIGRLRDNWDGYDAARIERAAFARARTLLQGLIAAGQPPEHLLPTAAGTLAFEWETPFGGARLEVGRTKFSFYTSPVSGEPILRAGRIEELDAASLEQALDTIGGPTTPHSLEEVG